MKTIILHTSDVSESNEEHFLQEVFLLLTEIRNCTCSFLMKFRETNASVISNHCHWFHGITKMLSLPKLNSDFFRQQIDTTVESISKFSVECFTIRTDQVFSLII